MHEERVLAGRYRLVRELGRGGRGVVHLAHDVWLDRDVAVKMIAADILSAEEEALFRREAKTIAQMDHPAITPIYDLCSDGDTLFLVMPVVAGQTLRHILQEGHLDLGSVLFIASRVARALEHTHAVRVAHRDIKPENVLVQREGNRILGVKVLDFGLAVRLEEIVADADVLSGTLQYLSPEQIEGGPAEAASDVHALGVVIYECLAGRRPFEGKVADLLRQIVAVQPLGLRERGIDVPEALDNLVLACLAKSPNERPTAGELAHVLEELIPSGLATKDRESRYSPQTNRPFADRLGDLLLIQGNFREAAELYRYFVVQVPEGAEAARWPWAVSEQSRRSAHLALRLGHYDEALELCRKGLQIIGDRDSARAGMLASLAGLICCASGELTAAEQWVREADDRLKKLRRGEQESREVAELEMSIARTVGNLHFARGQYPEALAAHHRAAELSSDLGDRWEHSIALYNAAETYAALGEVPEALECLSISHRLKTTLGDRWGLAYLHHLSGEIRLASGESKAAAEEASEGLALAIEVGDPKIDARLRILASRAYRQLGDFDSARHELERACRCAEAAGILPELEAAKALLGSDASP